MRCLSEVKDDTVNKECLLWERSLVKAASDGEELTTT
jgi:hypothetical protein